METAAIPIDYILASRRINYLHNNLTKEDSELVKRVYIAQKNNPAKGDWYHTVKMDMELIRINMTDCEIILMCKKEFKIHVKTASQAARSRHEREPVYAIRDKNTRSDIVFLQIRTGAGKPNILLRSLR